MGPVVPYGHRNMHCDVEKHMAHFVIFKQSIWRQRKRSQNLTKPNRIFKYIEVLLIPLQHSLK